jgi:hypothetical protein
MVVEKSSKATVHAPSLIRRLLKLGGSNTRTEITNFKQKYKGSVKLYTFENGGLSGVVTYLFGAGQLNRGRGAGSRNFGSLTLGYVAFFQAFQNVLLRSWSSPLPLIISKVWRSL